MIRVIRRYEFSAAHVLARDDWGGERNTSVYGKCANPAGHGHNYAIEVSVEGALDPVTGTVVALEKLDQLVRVQVLSELDGSFLNHDVAVFARSVPTAENIARHVWDRLVHGVSPARLVGIRLVETRNNSVEYAGSEDRV